MIDFAGAAIGFGLMLTMMALGLHVAAAIFLTSVLGAVFYFGPALLDTFATQLWAVMNSFILTAIPLFVLLGELLMRAGVTQRMYSGLSTWLGRLPGGLLHTNIGASGLFAAVSGSSVATAATISTVALPELRKRGYNERLVLGSIAAGATLGILIPPSVNLIIYGALTGTSIGQLFAAGIVPGLLLIGLFMLSIAVISLLIPGMTGKLDEPATFAEKMASLRHLIPPLSIFVVVMGTIYTGWATPTEAAAVGVLMAFALAAMNKALSISMLHDAFLSTVRTTAMILLIIMAIVLFVGCFIETIAAITILTPVLLPVAMQIGIDPVHFGIILILNLMIGLLTPPVGMVLYVLSKVADVPFERCVVATAPFLVPLGAVLLLLSFVPGLSMWLPVYLYR